MNTIIAARQKWINAISNRNMYNLLDCYHKNHIFKGTVVKKVTYTEHELKNYFNNLLEKNPSVTFIKSDLRKIDNLYFDSGSYVFSSPYMEQLNANYQFIYKLENGEPKIISHFSCSF